MLIDPSLRRFCLPQAGSVVVPAEMLAPQGLTSECAALLSEEPWFTPERRTCLEQGFRLYWSRCADLYRKAAGDWFAPRQTNLLIVENPRGVLPYLEPFRNSSALLYASDLDAHAEYVAVLLLHMERLALVQSPRAAMIGNLSYWFDRDSASRAAFAAAARRTNRPDAASFVALADALSWVDELLHDPLRLPERPATEPYIAVSGTGLYAPQRLQPSLQRLADATDAGIRDAFRTAAPLQSPGHSALKALCSWLESNRAHAIVVDADGSTLWTPEERDAKRVRRALKECWGDAVKSIHEDIRIVHERSRQFLDRVREPESLPTQCAVLETGNGAYVDPARRAVVYELKQPGFDARAAAAPPCHRLLLGARVMHEWGHVAHTARMIAVAPERKAEYAEARAELGERFAGVLAKVPPQLRDHVYQETRTLASTPADLPKALARKTLGRVGDYLSNLMMSHLIPGEEMQAYVRTNVTHHFEERLGVVSELARYAYEVHYLALAGVERDYFFRTSRFPDYFVATGIISEDDANALFDAAGRVLACYSIDETKFALRQ